VLREEAKTGPGLTLRGGGQLRTTDNTVPGRDGGSEISLGVGVGEAGSGMCAISAWSCNARRWVAFEWASGLAES
jgi:hypothetical protein